MRSPVTPALAALALAACVRSHPARFVDAPAVEDVGDRGPIPVPKRRDPLKETMLSEAYVERPVVQALDPKRAPEAGDVNALDDVPRSAWLSPEDAATESDAADPPAPPFRVLTEPGVTREGALAVVDARGRRFELWRDPVDRPEMATGAAAVASRLLRALGYATPGVWVTDVARVDFDVDDQADNQVILKLFRVGPRAVAGRFRVAFTRWPIGIDLGPTPATGGRSDDPNDRVPHEDRRTLRALKLIFGWLGMTDAGTHVLRDAYLGPPGKGHVVHYIAGLGGALGADAVVRLLEARDDDSDLADRDVWITLATLGLYHQKPRLTPETWPSVGEYRENWAPAAFQTSPPLVPIDRALPADLYWAAKRIAALPTATIVDALDTGNYHDDSARALLGELVRERRSLAVRWGLAQVTPCEVERLENAGPRARQTLVIRDEALTLGLVPARTTTYRVALIDAAGKPVAKPAEVRMSEGTLFPIELPEALPPYLVVRVQSVRDGSAAPRAMEAHLVTQGGAVRLVGIVH